MSEHWSLALEIENEIWIKKNDIEWKNSFSPYKKYKK
jgi:hypothetical protein